jgi:hypothetical protein
MLCCAVLPCAVLYCALQLGVATYACRVPERWFPGKFDIFGHSHQLWHLAVVLAAWVHYLAIMILLHWRDAAGELLLLASLYHQLGTTKPGYPCHLGVAVVRQWSLGIFVCL